MIRSSTGSCPARTGEQNKNGMEAIAIKGRARTLEIPLLALCIVAVAAVAVWWTDGWFDLSYISGRLGSRADWDDVWPAFEGRFELGLLRSEVLAILIELDPSLSSELAVDDELACVADHCCEVVIPFQHRVQRRFAYAFCYDRELRLRYVGINS